MRCRRLGKTTANIKLRLRLSHAILRALILLALF